MSTQPSPRPPSTAAAVAPSPASAVRSTSLSPTDQVSRMFEDYFLTTRDRGPLS